MWWILHIISCLLLTIVISYSRKYGLCFKSYMVYTSFMVLGNGWMIPIIFNKAPSFYLVWYLDMALLAVFGFLGSIFYFNEVISLINCIGIGFILIGVCLLVL